MHHMIKKDYVREPLRLASMLLMANIPFEIGEMCNGLIICYPCMGDGCVSDAICHDGSYGRNEGLLEIMGLVDKEKTGGDSVEGWLTAEEVFRRWQRHWLETRIAEEGE